MGKNNDFIREPGISLIKQVLHMKNIFPQFEFFKDGVDSGFWVGKLQPTPTSIEYKIKIVYPKSKVPSVFVLAPEIHPKAPHRYPKDDALCLYFPKDESFRRKYSMIADTIVPWTSEWLFLYEIWLETGVWWGLEAPHRPSLPRKRRIRNAMG